MAYRSGAQAMPHSCLGREVRQPAYRCGKAVAGFWFPWPGGMHYYLGDRGQAACTSLMFRCSGNG